MNFKFMLTINTFLATPHFHAVLTANVWCLHALRNLQPQLSDSDQVFQSTQFALIIVDACHNLICSVIPLHSFCASSILDIATQHYMRSLKIGVSTRKQWKAGFW